MLKKSTLREIKSSFARWLAIFAIVALGVGFFAGLKDTKASMVLTVRNYLAEHNMFDYQIMSSYGIDDESIELAEKTEGVSGAEGSTQIDVLVRVAGETADDENNEKVLKAISLPESINTLRVVEGRLPQSADECVVDDYELKGSSFDIGTTIVLSDNNDEDTLNDFTQKEFKIVGRVNTPIYLDYQRGTTSLRDGTLDTFFFVTKDAFDVDYYTQLYLTLEGNEPDFSDELDAKLKSRQDDMDDLAERITEARRETARADAQEELDEKIKEYEDSLAEYNKEKSSTEKKLNNAQSQINSGSRTLAEKKAEAQTAIETLNGQKAQIEAGIQQAEDGIQQAEAAHAAGMMSDDDYNSAIAAANATIDSLNGNLSQVNAGIQQAQAGLDEIAAQEKNLSSNQNTLNSNKKKARREFSDAESKLRDAKKKLDDAQEEIDEMETGNSYAFSRNDNAGYSSFDSNSSIVSNISKVFPVFFFLVAALVCMTTMTRMIDEQRTQIGILKALGYSNKAILGKYMFYAGSSAMLGAVFGFFVGCKVFPVVIWNAYTMMYDFSDTTEFVFDGKLMAISLAVALLCSVGATWVSVAQDFKAVPAQLIRPKTPRAGKRILLERITPLWNRISFLYKVSLRNIFRYKKRFFMMVLGVSGCTALLIAGIGISTTISRIAEYQYGEVSLYDYQIAFTENMDEEAQQDFIEFATDETGNRLGDVLFLHQASAEIVSPDKSYEMTLVASDSPDFEEFVSLHYGEKKIKMPGDGEIVIVRKIQKELGLEIGDEVTLRDGYREMKATVVGVSDNYVGEMVFMSEATYKKGFGKKPSIKAAYVKAPGGSGSAAADMGNAEREEEVREIATAAGQYEDAAAVVVNYDTLDMVDKMMESLNAVIAVVILCAGLLAFIVLYNLTNINITERIREIATIKVLGFNQLETSQYVFRENVFLTAIAALVGIPLGKLLLTFVIDNIVVSMIYFQPRIETINYVEAVILTFVFALIVNLAMQKRLRNVSMTESLKSIE